MEEQEKTEIKNKKEKKPSNPKKMIKNRVFFILFYTIILVGITLSLIYNQNDFNIKTESIKIIDEVQEEEKEKVKHSGLIDYDNDTYNMNDLKISEKTENYKGESITYYQIDGLLDKEIQKSINLDLKKDYEKLIDEFVDNYNIDEYSFVHYNFTSSNFANTMSIYYAGYLYKSDPEWNWRDNITYYACENYDLTTGKKISLNDLFTDDTKGNNIFSSNFYNEMVSGIAETSMNEETWDLTVTDYNDIEDVIFELCYRFNQKDIDTPFIFDTQKITLLEYNASIYYEDVLDYIAIYNRYKTSKSIFNGQYKKIHDLPVLSIRYDSEYQVLEKGDNYYIDLTLVDVYFSSQRQDNYDKIQNSVIEKINEDVDKIKEEAKNSPKFYVVNGYYSISAHGNTNWETNEFTGDGTYEVSCNISKYETTKSEFEKKVYPAIQKVERIAQRSETGEVYMYYNQFMLFISWKANWNDFEYNSNNTTLYIDREGNLSETPIWGVND